MRIILSYIVVLLFPLAATAQLNYGVGTGNWAGTASLYMNPASIADSRDKSILQIVSLNMSVDNSMGVLNPATGIGTLMARIAGGKGNDATQAIQNTGNANFNMFAPSAEILGPGFIATINHRHSIAITTRIRALSEFNNFSPAFYDQLNAGKFSNPGNNYVANFNWTSHLFSEINLSFGEVLLERGNSELKAGVTLRYLGGISYVSLKGAMNVHTNTGSSGRDSSFQVTDAQMDYNTDLIYKNNEFTQGLNSNLYNDFVSVKAGTGWGGDAGLIYEYQPDQEKYRYDMDGKQQLVDDSRNRYLFKLSASILDLGSINYSAASNYNMTVSGSGVLSGQNIVSTISNFTALRSYLSKQGLQSDSNTKAFILNMPTRLLLSADYHIYEHFYVNGAYQYNLASTANAGNYFYNQFVLTPRFDTRKISIGLPLGYSGLANDFKAGIGIRTGLLYFGSDDVLGILGAKAHGFNAYAGLHLTAAKTPPVDKKGKIPEELVEHPTVANWQVLAPASTTTLPNTNLFVALRIDSIYHFSSAASVTVWLDNAPINVLAKVNNNKLEFIYPAYIKNGKHTLRVQGKVRELEAQQDHSFEFSIGKVTEAGGGSHNTKEQVRLSGSVSVDDRQEALSGSGQNLRQEPGYTRNFNMDATASYKDMAIPIKIFATSDDRFLTQSPDFFQIGFRKKWFELTAGDMNPVFDRLVLNGVRVRGAGLTLKGKNNMLKVVYGVMNQPIQGVLQVATPGSGILLTNLAPGANNFDTVIAPGIYKRIMTAGRYETWNKKDNFRFGMSVMKAKDDTASIHYGVAPKENLVTGMDFALKLFHHAVSLQSGIAASLFTNDISTGPVSGKSLDTAYKVSLPFDPESVRNIMILNASSTPLNPGNFDYTSMYSSLNYSNKYQTFTVDYKKNGALYTSLGNPFLQSNYAGVQVSERFSLFKKKLGFSFGYSNFSTNQNMESYSTINTQAVNGNIAFNPGNNLPSLLLSYMNQTRNGNADSVIGLPGTNDQLNNYLFNISLTRKFWHLNHRFRMVININDRKDFALPQNSFNSVNWLLGISENFATKFTVNADGGKTLITNPANGNISNIAVYNLTVDWQIRPQHYFTSLSVSNNKTYFTPYSDQSYRLSVIYRFGYRFAHGMGVDLEGGYQPFTDQTNSLNSYSELYGYIRYTCDLSKLLTHDQPKPAANKF